MNCKLRARGHTKLQPFASLISSDVPALRVLMFSRAEEVVDVPTLEASASSEGVEE